MSRPGPFLLRVVKRSVKWVAWRVYAALPKYRRAVLAGFILYDDSVLAMEAALRGAGLRKTVILVPPGPPARPSGLGADTILATRRSLRSYAYLALARYVFFTHECLVHQFPRKVTSVHVGHGMPVKRIGWMNGDDGPLVPIAKYAVATSDFWAGIVQESLRPRSGALVTGIPRNDRMFAGNSRLREELQPRPASSGRLVVWLPTFRGEWETGVHTLGVPEDALGHIDRLLERYGGVMVVKPHPMALAGRPPEVTRFRFITDDWLSERGFTLYQLLGEADALITDVSSVYVDFMIRDRPIIHHFPDIREYELSRGFSMGPIEDYLAGPLTLAPEDLVAEVEAVLRGDDPAAGRRRNLTGLFHAHVDASATARLLSEVGLDVLPADAGARRL